MLGTPPPPFGLCFTEDHTSFVFDILRAWNQGSDENLSLQDLADFLSMAGLGATMFLDKEQDGHAYRQDEITKRCLLKLDLIRSIYYRLTFQTEPSQESRYH
jgi:hypothetical protein